MRDQLCVSLALHVHYLEVLHRARAPSRPSQKFVLAYPMMTLQLSFPLPQLQATVRRVHGHFASTTRVSHAAGADIAVTSWSWPDTAHVQAILQQQAMQTVVARGVSERRFRTRISNFA